MHVTYYIGWHADTWITTFHGVACFLSRRQTKSKRNLKGNTKAGSNFVGHTLTKTEIGEVLTVADADSILENVSYRWNVSYVNTLKDAVPEPELDHVAGKERPGCNISIMASKSSTRSMPSSALIASLFLNDLYPNML